MKYDNQGQPLHNVNVKQILTRDINEFIGICRGIVLDGEINYKEAKGLLEWIKNHNNCVKEYPVSEIAPKLKRILKKDDLNPTHSLELLDLLSHLLGSYRDENIINPSTTLALEAKEQDLNDDIAFDSSPVVIKGSKFVLTGKFTIGERKKIASLIRQLGGLIQEKAVTGETDYLVVGEQGSDYWKYSTHGRKMEHAVRLQKELGKIRIISEKHLMKYLED